MIKPRTTLALFAAVIFISGCRCASDTNDTVRIQKKVDFILVHLYVACKLAVAKIDNSPDIEISQKQLLNIISTQAEQPSVQVKNPSSDSSALATQETNTTMPRLAPALVKKKIVTLANYIWALQKEGAEVVRGESEAALTPILPTLLKSSGLAQSTIKKIDLPTEHALFYLVLSLLEAGNLLPIPFANRIILYEAWNTHPKKVKFPGLEFPLHGLKSWTYGSNNFCQLAMEEATKTESLSFDATKLHGSIRLLLQHETRASFPSKAKTESTVRAAAFGSVAYCHLRRLNDKAARPALAKFITHVHKAGLINENDRLSLQVFYDCGGDDNEIQAGKKKLYRLKKNAPKEKSKIGVLNAYCESANETTTEGARKVLFAGKLLNLAVRVIEEKYLGINFQNTALFQSIGGFTNTFETIMPAISDISGDVSKLLKEAKQILNQ